MLRLMTFVLPLQLLAQTTNTIPKYVTDYGKHCFQLLPLCVTMLTNL